MLGYMWPAIELKIDESDEPMILAATITTSAMTVVRIAYSAIVCPASSLRRTMSDANMRVRFFMFSAFGLGRGARDLPERLGAARRVSTLTGFGRREVKT